MIDVILNKRYQIFLKNLDHIYLQLSLEQLKGYEFTTYAARCIDNEITMFLRKIKKDKNVDSLDRTVYQDSEGSEFKLEDILNDESDLVENYEKAELIETLRELIKQLPYREREIVMMAFGFYNDRIYSQLEIANKFNLSQPTVSRILPKIIENLLYKLKVAGVIETHDKSNENEKDKKKTKKLKSIYEFFNNYTKEQIDEVISKLTDEERALIKRRYGDDLENPVQTKLSKDDINNFYGILVPKMKKTLKNPNYKYKSRKRKPKIQETDTEQQFKNDTESSSTTEFKEELAVKTEKVNTDITKDDNMKMLELLNMPAFTQMTSVLTAKESIILPAFTQTMNMLTSKESLIISLKLASIEGKQFSTESIAEFLGIEEIDVIETTKKVLLLYKENINSCLDNIIEEVTNTHDKALNQTLK